MPARPSSAGPPRRRPLAKRSARVGTGLMVLCGLPTSAGDKRTVETSNIAERLEFGPIKVAYDDRVLQPRLWTLAQSEWAAELAPSGPPGPLLEFGCGAAHIGLAPAVLSGRPLV